MSRPLPVRHVASPQGSTEHSTPGSTEASTEASTGPGAQARPERGSAGAEHRPAPNRSSGDAARLPSPVRATVGRPGGAVPAMPEVKEERIRALRRMKSVAGGLLLLAAVVYVLCRSLTDGDGVWGYVEAAAEASMVGGAADWFAVTALFRHPLRLPIPHTAIIPSKKDQIGDGLAEFVREYFLTSEIVAERVAEAQVPQRVGEWLADPEHAGRLAEEVSSGVAGMASVLRDDQLRDAVAAFADKRLREMDIAPLLARIIEGACDAGQHQAVLTMFLRGARRFLADNRGEFRARVHQESWLPSFIDEQLFNAGYNWTTEFLDDVVEGEDHELRAAFDRQLRDLAHRLRHDPDQIARVEAARDQLLDHPRIHEYLANLWDSVKALVLREADDPDSDLRRSAQSLVVRGGEVLRDDPQIYGRVDEALQRLVGHVVANYAEDLTGIISSTIERWDTAETSRRLELQVGRDLQFIRINGTVVGALVGLAIYAVTQLF